MRYEVIAELAINEFCFMEINKVRKAAKTLRRLRPHNIPWYERMLCDVADTYRLNKKLLSVELLIDIYPPSKPKEVIL